MSRTKDRRLGKEEVGPADKSLKSFPYSSNDHSFPSIPESGDFFSLKNVQ